MSKALNIAQYIYDKGYRSNLQLNKLLYLSFGFYGAATYGRHLFEDEIQAWKLGPVIPNVYFAFKANSFATKEFSYNLSPIEKEKVDEVLSFYGNKAPFLLVEITHQKNTPWSNSYKEGIKNIKIEKEAIINYYKNFLYISNELVDVMSDKRFKEIIRDLSKT